MPGIEDLHRLRNEYEDRARRLDGSDIYSWFNPANLFTIQQRQRSLLSLLKNNHFMDLPAYSILEIGCGSGGVLTELLSLGADPYHVFGIDLLLNRLQEAHHRLPVSGLVNADGQRLPFPNKSFDLVFQYTAISSILDRKLRQNIAQDMLRVLRSGGLILSYDFWLNPTNNQTRGIRPIDIRQMFPNCSYKFQKITLAPPLARRIVPISWGLAHLLESLKIFNSHYLVAITPEPGSNNRD